MDAIRLEYLFQKYYDKTATAEERSELMGLVDQSENDPAVKSLIDAVLQKSDVTMELDSNTADGILEAILKADEKAKVHSISFARIAAAVTILVLLTVGGYFYFNKNENAVPVAVIKNNDVVPGKNGAILKLANGKQIILDSAGNGNLAQQSNIRIVKNGSEISYVVDPSTASTEMIYDELSTPRGRQFRLVLSDGSKVWLNAASSIKFPTAFNGKERRVEVTGEVYFEVVHNEKRPFTVISNGTEIHDIGTEFNVNAYTDEEKIKVTLVEGSVKVIKGNSAVFLSPGKQAILRPFDNAQGKQDDIRVVDADLEESLAWKNGFFSFHSADIPTVMRQLSRWYDVDIAYSNGIPKREFEGSIDRNLNLSRVLKILEKMQVHFKIEDKKIIILP